MAPGPDGESAPSGWVFDIKRYAVHDGPGIRTTVFFKGCPLRCRWCHNPESWQAVPQPSLRRSRCVRCRRCVELCRENAVSFLDDWPVTDAAKCVLCGECVTACPAGAREIIGRKMTVAEVMSQLHKDVVFYDQSGGGATFSGGEPLMQPEFLMALLTRCRAEGIHCAVDTTCHATPQLMRRVADAADLLLCDVKHMDPQRHRRYTGVSNEQILGNIQMLAAAGARIIVRIPVIPGFNDDKTNVEATSRFVRSLRTVRRIDLLPYNRGGLEKAVRLAGEVDLMDVGTPNRDTMDAIASVLRDDGFEVKVGG